MNKTAAQRSQARRATLTKAAEALDAAYAEGFCKAAEAMRVDPVALYKQAFVGKLLGLGARALGGAVGGGLHLGGSMARGAGTVVGGALDMAGRGVRRYASLLAGGRLSKYRGVEKALKNKVNNAIAGGLLNPANDYGNALAYHTGMRSLGRLAPRIAAEQRAVDAARAVTTMGTLGGAGYGAYRAYGSTAPAAEDM